MLNHVQIVSCCLATNDNHLSLLLMHMSLSYIVTMTFYFFWLVICWSLLYVSRLWTMNLWHWRLGSAAATIAHRSKQYSTLSNQSINQHELAIASHIQSSEAPEIQYKYKNITVSQLNTHYRIVSYGNDSDKRWVLSLLRKRVEVDEVRICRGRRFQEDGAATEN